MIKKKEGTKVGSRATEYDKKATSVRASRMETSSEKHGLLPLSSNFISLREIPSRAKLGLHLILMSGGATRLRAKVLGTYSRTVVGSA